MLKDLVPKLDCTDPGLCRTLHGMSCQVLEGDVDEFGHSGFVGAVGGDGGAEMNKCADEENYSYRERLDN